MEWSLALASVAHPPRGLHLHDLQKTGVLTEILAVISEVDAGWQRGSGHEDSCQGGGPRGAPSVLLPAVAASRLPQQPVERGQA
jgi:hypothetical protein